MSFKPYTDRVPSGIRWFKDLEDFGKKSRGGALVTIPGNPKRPYRPWADPQTVNQTADSFSNFYSAPNNSSRTYKVIARDASGYPLLTSINSPEFYNTYSVIMNPPNIAAYRQYSYMFTKGVPFLKSIILYPDLDRFEEPNFTGYLPGVDYPLELRPTDMMVVQNGEVKVIDVYDFIQLVSVRDVSSAEKLKLVDNIRSRTDMTDDDKVKAIHEVTIWNKQEQVVI